MNTRPQIQVMTTRQYYKKELKRSKGYNEILAHLKHKKNLIEKYDKYDRKITKINNEIEKVYNEILEKSKELYVYNKNMSDQENNNKLLEIIDKKEMEQKERYKKVKELEGIKYMLGVEKETQEEQISNYIKHYGDKKLKETQIYIYALSKLDEAEHILSVEEEDIKYKIYSEINSELIRRKQDTGYTKEGITNIIIKDPYISDEE